MKTHAHKLDSRELATVLASLRYYQDAISNLAPSSLPRALFSVSEIATEGGTFEPLSPEEIDSLCKRLNLDGMPCALTDELLSTAADELTANIDCMRGPEFAAARGSSAALGLRIRRALSGIKSSADKLTTLRPVEILPVNRSGDCRTGHLAGISRIEIEGKLGMLPNVKDDPAKVRWSWGFTVNGVRCGVWDWKGSGDVGEWSTFGPHESLALVFGAHAVT